jgi:hypothetical protein
MHIVSLLGDGLCHQDRLYDLICPYKKETILINILETQKVMYS